MSKKHWVITIIFAVFLVGVLYWYFNYRLPETTPTQGPEETKKTETEGIKSIELEKPPFIKD